MNFAHAPGLLARARLRELVNDTLYETGRGAVPLHETAEFEWVFRFGDERAVERVNALITLFEMGGANGYETAFRELLRADAVGPEVVTPEGATRDEASIAVDSSHRSAVGIAGHRSP